MRISQVPFFSAKGLHHFVQGLLLQHVDYSTRHFSRPYDIGFAISIGSVLCIPAVSCVLFGFWLGYMVWG